MPFSTKDIKLEENKFFLFVGPADSGKTYAATSWGLKSKEFGGEDPRPCYLMDCDGRVAALRNRPVMYDTFTNVDGAIGVLNRLEELREKCVAQKSAPFHTLIAPDSFSGFCELAIADAMEVKEGKDKGRRIGELTLPTFEDYGYESESVRKLLWESLTDIKKYANVIVTAHEVEKYKTVITKPGQPAQNVLDGYKILARDKISAKMPTKFDEIYHFQAKEKLVSSRSIRRKVVFVDQLARSTFPQLNRSTEEFDISGREFYTWWREKINE